MPPHPLLLALFALTGLAMGSFINVCSDRLPVGRSIVSPPSACEKCGRQLGPKDLVPLFSYLWLRGRCRYCGSPIPWRLPAVEIAVAAVFALLYWYYGLSLMLLFSLIYACLLTIVFVIDVEQQLILDVIVYPGMALALALSPLYPALGTSPGTRVISSALGGAIGLALMILPFLIARGGMGFGDVKMAALVGLMTGFPEVFFALFLSILSGGLVAIVLLAGGLKKRRQPIPFGPFLAIGTMAMVVWGNQIQYWYGQLIT